MTMDRRGSGFSVRWQASVAQPLRWTADDGDRRRHRTGGHPHPDGMADSPPPPPPPRGMQHEGGKFALG